MAILTVMASPQPFTGSVLDRAAWQELEDEFEQLGQLARTTDDPEAFYRRLLDACLRALGGDGGAVWLRSASSAMRPIVTINWAFCEFDASEARCQHEDLLAKVAADGTIAIANSMGGREILLAPIRLPRSRLNRDDDVDTALDTVAIIELHLPRDMSPAARGGCEQFMVAASETAAEFQVRDELRALRREKLEFDGLLRLGRDVHRSLDLVRTAYSVANEGRRFIDCDRLSVLGATGHTCRLLATSGVSRFDRRSTAARGLERLAELVRSTDEPASYIDGQTDAMPPVDEVLEAHTEHSHARQIAAIPLRRVIAPDAVEAQPSLANGHRKTPERPRFVLVAEQFNARPEALALERLVEVGQVCSTALYNAHEVDQLAFGWLLRPLTSLKRLVARRIARSSAIALAVGAAIAALVLVPAEFTVEAPGTLMPVVRRDVFAPRTGLVDEVLVATGDEVAPGQALVRLRDPQLDLELNRVHGELATAERQLAAVRATRTRRDARDPSEVESYRLSAEERELDQRLTNLREERDLLTRQRDALVVSSPIAGKVLTWDVGNRLIARPVEQGEVLLTVADPSGDWQLELEVPDAQIGHVVAAQSSHAAQLPVEFRLSSDDRELHIGTVRSVGLAAHVDGTAQGTTEPTVLVEVAIPQEQLEAMRRGELRAGVSARARIACGERSLGYVWLHDIWDGIIGSVRF